MIEVRFCQLLNYKCVCFLEFMCIVCIQETRRGFRVQCAQLPSYLSTPQFCFLLKNVSPKQSIRIQQIIYMLVMGSTMQGKPQ